MEKEKLREGYTTGACATAATKAALCALITGVKQTEATIMLPIGREVTFAIVSCEMEEERASATVIKDGGDDPDVTHGASIVATVSWAKEGIHIDGGEGVGRATKPGLPIPVGEAAINPVPRQMMMDVANELMTKYGIKRGVRIIISVPNGEEIAKKTLNGRLGIVGGISILGTRGIVVPFSTSAYRASIVRALEVAVACGCDHVVVTTGGRSETYAMKQYPHLKEEAFIEMGDFVGFTLKQCKRLGIQTVSLVGMMGKFSKVAQGVMMVHSKSAPVDFQFLADVAKQAGAPTPLIEAVKQANTASQVGDMMYEAGYLSFFDLLCDYCCQHALREVNGGLTVETTLYTLKGQCLGKAVRSDGANEVNRDWC
ncbi:cobalt-precorrin-6A synthase [Anoxybacillus flavithermus NBRC 109594]|uniref:Cobalt-precorrin-5B C(1)-methyltransferase n=1 Tax=Anoxybacillus flavithermus NBRC 109594 TaxID=1315967 RepID=R4FZW7_9BACL|nr:cobalt-precorrin-5B (C(1))-methyltransferase [Anoxybacillus flavithermus]MCX8047737.1 cobalt-precorrin-5B (C(1))-methyltransferase [Anoxybacillus gonensis]GAC90159.1 cobalt-precorrin-6A synthase [Anoxybacillus flavithermus NBRC 109594]